MKTLIKNKLVIGLLAVCLGIFLGWVIFSPHSQTANGEEHAHDSIAEVWTCSMHPSVRQTGPGKCPICGMDLIPLENMGEDSDPELIELSETAMKLANVQTMVIGSSKAEGSVRLNGKVMADERMISSQAAHIPGRIEQLRVNFTGERVQKGEIVAYVYSPELVTAQHELFEAYSIRESQPALYEAAREKLKNWKLDDERIDAVLESGAPTDRFPLRADASGIVLKRKVTVGDYVERGAALYDVVDFSRVWVQFDIHEKDIPSVNEGDEISFTVKSIPGKTFTEKISFIDPVIDPQTRAASARVEMRNPGAQLKPEMFVSGVVQSRLDGQDEIVVPKSAVMWTGERSIVYVKETSDGSAVFRFTEVVLGPSIGELYVIEEGLSEGMEVVVNGAFTIDAAAQLAGKASMMSPPRGESSSGPAPGLTDGKKFDGNDRFKKQLAALIKPYIRFKDALVATNSELAASEATELIVSVRGLEPSGLEGPARDWWKPHFDKLANASEKAAKATEIEIQRVALAEITQAYFAAITAFGPVHIGAYYQFCPMAFDNKGGYWISEREEIKNPYFGTDMLTCGETISPIE